MSGRNNLNILKLIRQICADQGVKNGAQIEMQCEKAAEIQEQLTGKAPTCEAGKTYDGCATECSYITCEMAVENDNNWEPTDKCEDNGFSDKLFSKNHN